MSSLKDEGNRYFNVGDFLSAEGLYSQAILADPKNPALYTNRAMARLKLGYHDLVISDCLTCLSFTPHNLKANYLLSQAQLCMGDHDNAIHHALEAHRLCVLTGDRSLSAVTALVLRCKKQRWDYMERMRVREHRQLEGEVLGLMRRDRDEMLVAAAVAGDEAEGKCIMEDAEGKMKAVSEIFEKARQQSDKRREVPEWAIDDISFGIMVDPVITKTGKSYERASIMEHLRRHPSDPLTRDPLLISDLRPNLGLRQACEEFLEENGWAVDW